MSGNIRYFIAVLLTAMSMLSSGCGGNVNVQSSGGGADGFAALGALILGTSALRWLRESEPRQNTETADDPVDPPPTLHPDDDPPVPPTGDQQQPAANML